MIRSCRDKRTARFVAGDWVPEFQGIVDQARRRIDLLQTARSLDDLRYMRSNRLEMLRGDRAGQYSIRINDQWRICFHWTDEGVENVEIVDYH